MMRVVQKYLILAAILVLGISSFSYSETPAKEANAQVALSKLKAPLHKDVDGFVRWIEAPDGQLSDAALKLLPGLAKLEWLEIGKGNVTPAGLANLKSCTTLKRLYIHDIKLDGAPLDWLAALTKLEALSLQRTGVDGKFLKNLKATETLTVLNISNNPIVNDDLAQIAVLKNLEVLGLANTKINMNGMAKLEGMKRLNELNLTNCPVSPEDVQSFLTMPNLRIVYAEGCNIGDMDVMEMKNKFPMLAIFR
jgi:hypothetical protein